MTSKKALIVIPAYNEENIIGRVVTEIKHLNPDFPILVINDGSLDRTAEEARAAGAMVVSHPYNLGIGGAVQTGFKVAQSEDYEATVQMDGDAQHHPAYLKTVLEPVLSGKLEMCIGSRFLTEDATFRSTFIRRIGIRFFAVFLGILTGIHVTDPTSGYRATSKELIKKFARYYPIDFPEPEAIKIAKRLGARIGEVPVKMRKRLGGVSSIRYFATFYYMIKVTLAILIDGLKKEKRGT